MTKLELAAPYHLEVLAFVRGGVILSVCKYPDSRRVLCDTLAEITLTWTEAFELANALHAEALVFADG